MLYIYIYKEVETKGARQGGEKRGATIKVWISEVGSGGKGRGGEVVPQERLRCGQPTRVPAVHLSWGEIGYSGREPFLN